MPPHPLINTKETQMYYQNEQRFNGVFSRKKLPKKIKNGAYVINLDEYADIGTHWIVLFCNRSKIVYFDSFGVEEIPEEMFWYFCIEVIDFMVAGKKLIDYTSLFSPYDFKKNDDIILSCFKNE